MNPSCIILDKFEYDALILGTGFLESCITAILSVQKQQCLVLDLDNSYSSGIKTCNLKEFPQLMKKIQKQEEGVSDKLKKDWNYYPLEIKLPEGINEPEEMKLAMYKNFNLDINTRFLQSTSPAVTLLQNADMDKYMDFTALQGIKIYLDNQFVKVPETKGEIFSSKHIGILEKRSLWKCIGALIDAGRMYKQEQIDVNSTEEWEKGVEGGEICKQFEDENCLNFFSQFKNTDKINEIILYVIAAYEQNAKLSTLKTKDLVERVYGYVRSLGIHSQFPYLYTNYGTGDISQGFSRIAAVNGGIFILNENLEITRIEETEKNGKQAWKIFTPLAGETEFLTCNSIIVGPEYKKSLNSIIKVKGQEDKINSFEITKTNYLLREIIIFDKNENNQKDPHASPSIWIIPPNQFKNQQHPITIISFNNLSNSVPKSKFSIEYKTIIDFYDNTQSEQQNLETKELANQINKFFIKELELETYSIHFQCTYLQMQRDHQKSNFSQIYYLPDDDFSLFFDNYIPVLNQFLQNYFPENYLSENAFKKVQQEEEKKEKESDEEDNDMLSQLLGNLKDLEIKEDDPKEKEQKEIQHNLEQNQQQNLQYEEVLLEKKESFEKDSNSTVNDQKKKQ